MKAKVDKDKCIGCTLCVQICPQVFRMEDDKAVAYVDTMAKEIEGSCKQAANDCPVNAIIIE